MDKDLYSSLAHASLAYSCPASAERIEALLARLALPEGVNVIDVGCAKGELLVQLVERYAARGVGLDPLRSFIADARERVRTRVPDADLVLLPVSAARYPKPPEPFDAAFCLGATHVYGPYEEALKGLHALVRPGGRIVVGETYWKAKPAPEYLKALGVSERDARYGEQLVEAAHAHGLRTLESEAITVEEFDAYEDAYRANIEQHAAANPGDADAKAMVERARKWFDLYRQYGRDALGFMLLVFERV